MRWSRDEKERVSVCVLHMLGCHQTEQVLFLSLSLRRVQKVDDCSSLDDCEAKELIGKTVRTRVCFTVRMRVAWLWLFLCFRLSVMACFGFG